MGTLTKLTLAAAATLATHQVMAVGLIGESKFDKSSDEFHVSYMSTGVQFINKTENTVYAELSDTDTYKIIGALSIKKDRKLDIPCLNIDPSQIYTLKIRKALTKKQKKQGKKASNGTLLNTFSLSFRDARNYEITKSGSKYTKKEIFPEDMCGPYKLINETGDELYVDNSALVNYSKHVNQTTLKSKKVGDYGYFGNNDEFTTNAYVKIIDRLNHKKAKVTIDGKVVKNVFMIVG